MPCKADGKSHGGPISLDTVSSQARHVGHDYFCLYVQPHVKLNLVMVDSIRLVILVRM